MKNLSVHEDDRAFFERAGLTRYDAFFELEGAVVSNKGKRPVYRITVSDGKDRKVFYLKKTPRCPARDLFKRIRKGIGPHGDAYLENAQVELCKRSGVPVMRIAAWGENRAFGWPVAGFLLAAEVKGERLDRVIKTCTDDERKRIFIRYGELIAKMHLNGLRDIARVQDIIYSYDDEMNLTVIDREHGIPKTTSLTENDRLNALARTYLKNLSALGAQDAMIDELQALLDGYCTLLRKEAFDRLDLESRLSLEIAAIINQKKKFRKLEWILSALVSPKNASSRVRVPES